MMVQYSKKAAIHPFVLMILCGLLTSCASQKIEQISPKVDVSVEGKTLTDPWVLINNANIPKLQELMVSGELSAEALTQYYLEQITLKNSQLNAIISVNPKAIEIARMLDKERASGKVRGPLHGIPIVVKDNIETLEMATTAGSLALKDNFTARDAKLIVNLKEAGAIILAKTNLSEWANFRSERSSSGWSGIGGQTRNPHDLSRSTCGSSSGSGAAIAANLAVAAVGTETDGSITCPSSATGVVGIKPTVGLISRGGIVPISHTQDTAGPMAKNVTDAAILLSAMQGKDLDDSATLSRAFDFQKNYLNNIQITSFNGLRVGILEPQTNPHEALEGIFKKVVGVIKNEGAVVIDGLKFKGYKNFNQDSYDVLLFEFKADLNQYLANLPNGLNQLKLKDLIDFNNQHQSEEMDFFQQEIFEKAQSKGDLKSKAYLQALKNIQTETRKNGLDLMFKQNQLDVLITPTMGAAWSIDLINGDQYTGGYSSYSAIAGYPHITVPMGKIHNMPVGLSLIGLALTEKQLIEIALAFEKLDLRAR